MEGVAAGRQHDAAHGRAGIDGGHTDDALAQSIMGRSCDGQQLRTAVVLEVVVRPRQTLSVHRAPRRSVDDAFAEGAAPVAATYP